MINEFRVELGLPTLTHSHNLSGQSKIWAMGLWRGVAPPLTRAAVFSGVYGGEDIETGVLSMLDQRKHSGQGGICKPGRDCQAWRVLMNIKATKVGCSALETEKTETIIICTTDSEVYGFNEAVY